MAEDKGIFYNNRVLLGNWYEATTLEEYKLKKFLKQMEKGEIMLAKYRKMTENLRRPTVLTQSSNSVRFGARIALLAPHVPASDSPIEDSKGLLLGGRISSDEINYIQDLEDGCSVVCAAEEVPTEMNTFIITSSDYCKRDGDPLKYNQEFLMALSSSIARNKPLYLRYDPNAIPGLCGKYPLYISRHPVTSTRWRALPVQTPEITRFEMEGQPVPVNKDVIINHCATNVNLGINIGCWTMGFYGKVCCPVMKTCLDVYGRETAHNIWQIYTPIADGEKKE
ncbi:cilia- and flagella-associated protein 161-like isoform X2 [Aricia agestis]|uniref:cilia- and flagella-associated protein 161-like isoform X2 n=1 Tax=Aricia agestis TaxID=91739 RepID=UPI001C207950|nr:cilia- and flagella-associated protein 161-like isoform X2 [Aricia agestis]